MSELRWNPILEEWVVTATHRQERTYKPPADFCPLCPTKDPAIPTEVPASDYDIVVFENRFPSFKPSPPIPAVEPTGLYKVAPAQGVCEVVLYTPEHSTTLTDQSIEKITDLVEVWTDRYRELGSLEYVKYVMIFENKGDVIGVTLHHPHGQIYAFPFIPPRPAKELESSGRHIKETGRCLFCDMIGEELKDGRRLVEGNEDFVAFIPFFARYPYEVHIFPRRHRSSLLEFEEPERRTFARMLKTVMMAYDNLFGFSFPYMMIMHQAPTDGGDYAHYHFHVEFYPPYRTATKLKYLAGCESGAGTFINDTLPEEKAEELRRSKPHYL
ncbi:MAG: galactose-1-phosphate uridylyltransferase [Firmicutes bacterium]|nr:galactose-1-phosphate uridylyltransferase [Bacillota bacterium]